MRRYFCIVLGVGVFFFVMLGGSLNALCDDGPRPMKIGVLLPLSGDYGDYGKILLSGMRQAAIDPQTQSFTMNLDVHDTAAEGVASATHQAVEADDRVILGPLTRGETSQVSAITNQTKTPVISFTSDEKQKRDNLWIMGVTPQEQIQQLVLQAEMEGRRNFVALLPENGLGHAMGDSLIDMCRSQKLRDPRIVYHGPLEENMDSIFSTLGFSVAQPQETSSQSSNGPSDTQQQHNSESSAASAQDGAAHEGLSYRHLPENQSQQVVKSDMNADHPDVLVMADTGRSLKHIAAELARHQIAFPTVRVLGPALWSSLDEQFDGLQGAWYATLDPRPRQRFMRYYMVYEHQIPNPLADLAYDAANALRTISLENKGKFSADILCRDDGFSGAEGHFVFLHDGRMRRDLSVYEITGAGHMPRMVALSDEK